MVLAIIILCVASLVYIFANITAIKSKSKSAAWWIITRQVVKAIAVIFMALTVCRLTIPYYLVSMKPGIVKEMIVSMQEQQNANLNKEIRKYVRKEADSLTANAPILGNPKAEKTIFIWTDFACPYCRRVHKDLERIIGERKDVRVVIKNFPIHAPLSDAAARATIAAKIQDEAKAAEFVDMLMTRDWYTGEDYQDIQSGDKKKVEAARKRIEKTILKIAEEAGLDSEQIKKDMEGDVVFRELSSVRSLAARFEIGGTPFLIVNEQAFPGLIPYDRIIKALK